MQTLSKALQAFMRPFGPYHWYHFDKKSDDMAHMVRLNDPFQQAQTVDLETAILRINVYNDLGPDEDNEEPWGETGSAF